MRVLKKVLALIDLFNEKIAKLAAWVSLALVFAITYEVIMRYFFKKPTLWSYDVSYMLNSIAVVMGFAWVYKIKGHINVDVFYNNYPRKVQLLMDVVLVPLLILIPWAFVMHRTLLHVLNSIKLRELAMTGTLLPPIYPFKIWIFIGMLLLYIQVLAEFIRSTTELFGGEPE